MNYFLILMLVFTAFKIMVCQVDRHGQILFMVLIICHIVSVIKPHSQLRDKANLVSVMFFSSFYILCNSLLWRVNGVYTPYGFFILYFPSNKFTF